jgi:hypothetical protein
MWLKAGVFFGLDLVFCYGAFGIFKSGFGPLENEVTHVLLQIIRLMEGCHFFWSYVQTNKQTNKRTRPVDVSVSVDELITNASEPCQRPGSQRCFSWLFSVH